jgi:hypothetical protein
MRPRGSLAGPVEYLEFHLGEQVSNVCEAQWITQVGTIAAEVAHGFSPGQNREFRQLDVHYLTKDLPQHAFGKRHNVCLIDERSLYINLRKFRLAVSA